MIYIFFQPGCEFSTLKNPEIDTLLDYIVSYIKVVKMEVTLTSTFYSKVTSSMIYIFFQPGIEFSTLKKPENGSISPTNKNYSSFVKDWIKKNIFHSQPISEVDISAIDKFSENFLKRSREKWKQNNYKLYYPGVCNIATVELTYF